MRCIVFPFRQVLITAHNPEGVPIVRPPQDQGNDVIDCQINRSMRLLFSLGVAGSLFMVAHLLERVCGEEEDPS